MFCRCTSRLWKARQITSYDPKLFFEQLQVGTVLHQQVARAFVLNFFSDKLFAMGITEGRVHAMDAKSLSELVRSLLFERYVSVPFSLFTFDFEFTGLPGRTSTPASIIEIALYCPDTDRSFSTLVRPLSGSELTEDAAKLTKIRPEDLSTAPTFDYAWRSALEFVESNALDDASKERVLFLSHGAKMADVKMLHSACDAFDITVPPEIKFGDTYNTIRDLHRRRPVTKDKHPPSWSLTDLAFWLNIDVPPSAHRALPDAKLTWDVLYHTLDRYGESGLTPRQQLVARHYAELGDEQLSALVSTRNHKTPEVVSVDDVIDGLE